MSNHVPGSGTSPPITPHGFFFPFFPPATTFVGLFPIPQTLVGIGGGVIGTHTPFSMGSTKLRGNSGPNPGNPGRLRADSNGIGRVVTAVPMDGSKGSSNFIAGGSNEEVACCGTSDAIATARARCDLAVRDQG